MKAIITVGISGSGKTTWAEDFCEENVDYVNINRDDVRFALFNDGVRDWSEYKFNKANEGRVSEVIDQQMFTAMMETKNIIISDTNLTKKYRDRLTSKLEGWGYEVEFKEFDITLEEAWKRNSNRVGGIENHIVYSQYRKWCEYKGRKTYEPDYDLTKAVIVDIDGTVADMKGVRGPFDWAKVGEDKPRYMVLSMVEGFVSEGYDVIFLSGRDGKCYQDTKDWLDSNFSYDYKLFMRDSGDCRKDTVIKEEIFWENVAPDYCVMMAIDDRPCVIRLWHEIGIKNVISVANPWEEF